MRLFVYMFQLIKIIKMRKYIFTLSSDQGIYKLTVVSSNLMGALKIVYTSQNCPESAVVNIKIKDVKPPKKTV